MINSRRSGRKVGGFTLVEALITMMLAGLVLSFVAGLCNEYSRIMRYSTKKDQTLINLQMALERVKNELGEAGTTPVPGDSSVLQFDRIDPKVTDRLAPSSPPALWNPYDSAYVVTVKYRVEDNEMLRTTTFPGPKVVTESVASNISGFSWTDLGDGTFQINASFIEDNNVVRALSVIVQSRARW